MTRLALKILSVLVLSSALIYFVRTNVSRHAAAQSFQPDTLAGIWGYESVFGPSVRGELTLVASQPQWRAKIAGLEVPIRREKDAISFSLPNDSGEFRGHISADGNTITGDWIQPAGVTLNNRYATPVRFSQAHTGVWTGQVEPLDDRMSLYVSNQRSQDALISSYIRNPEINFFPS
jgi:hypothetical protein